LNRPVNFFGAVMKIGVGEIVPAGIIAITIAASKDVFRLPDRPDLRATQQLYQNIIVGHLTPVLPSLWSTDDDLRRPYNNRHLKSLRSDVREIGRQL
jgi:hypothetical protein